MSKIRLHGSSSGYTEIAPVAASGNNTLTLPNDGTIISKDSNGVIGVTSITVGTGVTVGDGRVTATSFVGSGANLTGITAGITMATQWRVTSDFTIGTSDSNYHITSNWETADSLGFGKIGSDLTESSGVFSFPSTGIYRIFAHTVCNNTSSASYRAQLAIHVTTDNSSYDTAAVAKHSFSSPAEQSGGMNCEYLFDVTSTSTHKFKIVVRSYQDNIKFQGDTDKPQTSINVFRLGDT